MMNEDVVPYGPSAGHPSWNNLEAPSVAWRCLTGDNSNSIFNESHIGPLTATGNAADMAGGEDKE